MKHYVVAEITVTDPKWVADYVKSVTPMVERHGGRYLARTSDFERMEGSAVSPQLLLLVEFPSREAAVTFYDCEEYRPYRERRVAGSRGQFYLVAGEDSSSASRA